MDKATLAELLTVQSILTVVPVRVEPAKHPHRTPAPAIATGQSPRARDPRHIPGAAEHSSSANPSRVVLTPFHRRQRRTHLPAQGRVAARSLPPATPGTKPGRDTEKGSEPQPSPAAPSAHRAASSQVLENQATSLL